MEILNTYFKKHLDLFQLLAVFLIAFIIRFLWIINIDSYPTMDGYEYYVNAIKLSNEEFVGFYWPIGYSFLLAIPMKLGFGNLFFLKLLNVILSSATTVILYLISKIFVFDKKFRFCCALLLIFYPELVFFTSLLWNETLFIFCFALFYLLFLKKKYFLSSIIFSISLFVKPVIIFFPILFVIFDKGIRNKGRRLFKIYLVVLVIHLPWSIYIYTKADKFVFVSTNGATNLFIGNNKYASGHYDEEGFKNISQFPNNELKEIVFDFWVNDYQSLPHLVLKKVSYLIFGMPKPWISSVGIGTNLYSGLPRYIEKRKILFLLEKYPEDQETIGNVYQINKEGESYTLREGVDELSKAAISNKILYSGLMQYELEEGLRNLNIFSYWINLFLVSCFVLRLIYFGLRMNQIYLVPIYFILFYSIFFGDFRFFLPAMPFVIVGNFVTKRKF